MTTVWADERVYYPLHAEPYTPACHFAEGQDDPGFRTKLQIAADLVVKALAAGVVCRAVVADSFYGDHDGFRGELRRRPGWVSSWRSSRRRGTWDYGADAYTPKDAARAGLERPRRSRRLAPGATAVPRRAHRDLVGR